MKPASGLLSNNQRPFGLQRYPVSDELSDIFEYYWAVDWNLGEGESFSSINIPYPCAHIVFEKGHCGIFGPVKGSFTKSLQGQGSVLGARIKTGYAVPFTGLIATQLIDRHVDLGMVFPLSNKELDARLEQVPSIETKISWMNEVVTPQISKVDIQQLKKAKLVYDCCQEIEKQDSLYSVDELQNITGHHPRKLERLFKEFIGLSPKWVIRLYRLQQMADHLMKSEDIDWADLSQQLGYFDQAHCIRDFKAFTGKTPGTFR